ncbi:MAG: acyl-CoA reductase, partial [Eudoraea sp.]|nr:acyl-CoA reductase [Eudoraea sp.]
MATLEERLKAFVKLGDFLRNYTPGKEILGREYDELKAVLVQARLKNAWFTDDNLLYAL